MGTSILAPHGKDMAVLMAHDTDTVVLSLHDMETGRSSAIEGDKEGKTAIVTHYLVIPYQVFIIIIDSISDTELFK